MLKIKQKQKCPPALNVETPGTFVLFVGKHVALGLPMLDARGDERPQQEGGTQGARGSWVLPAGGAQPPTESSAGSARATTREGVPAAHGCQNSPSSRRASSTPGAPGALDDPGSGQRPEGPATRLSTPKSRLKPTCGGPAPENAGGPNPSRRGEAASLQPQGLAFRPP